MLGRDIQTEEARQDARREVAVVSALTLFVGATWAYGFITLGHSWTLDASLVFIILMWVNTYVSLRSIEARDGWQRLRQTAIAEITSLEKQRNDFDTAIAVAQKEVIKPSNH